VEHGATRAGVGVRCEHVVVFTVIACDSGGLRATSVNTADGAVDGADTSTKSSGDS